jgi:gliding motility-associated-like protein
LLIICFTNSFSQVADTVFVGQTKTYKVKNQQNTSWLYWDISQGEILSENPTQSDSIVVQWNKVGMQTISVYEQNVNNCIGETSEIEILVIENDFEIELDIPNVFTPNEDKKNDYFTIGYIFPPENYKITIFNRWGTTVFETHDINYSWDGRISGEYCTPGVYYYVIQYKNKDKIETKKGFLHVFR